MKLVFRLLWLVLTQRLRTRIDLLDTCETSFRVLPNDLDVLMHVNNGVYLTLADLGRVDLLLRCGVHRKVKAAGWYPVAAAATVHFRRSLRLWQRFTIATRVLGWDDHSVYLEQVFHSQGQRIATAVIDARFLKRSGGTVSTEEVLAVAGGPPVSPPLPDWLHGWKHGIRSSSSAGAQSD